ncbi:MAG: endonuclease domain-containing protein [bacterium]
MKIYYNPKLKELARQMRNNPTYAEKSLWYALKEDQLSGYDFHRQKPIGDFIFDFYSFDLNLVIEVDGYTHESEKVKENDLKKDNFIKEIGFNILRFTDDEVLGNPNKVVKKIEEYVEWFEKKNLKKGE